MNNYHVRIEAQYFKARWRCISRELSAEALAVSSPEPERSLLQRELGAPSTIPNQILPTFPGPVSSNVAASSEPVIISEAMAKRRCSGSELGVLTPYIINTIHACACSRDPKVPLVFHIFHI